MDRVMISLRKTSLLWFQFQDYNNLAIEFEVACTLASTIATLKMIFRPRTSYITYCTHHYQCYSAVQLTDDIRAYIPNDVTSCLRFIITIKIHKYINNYQKSRANFEWIKGSKTNYTWNQAIKAIFSESNILIAVANGSIDPTVCEWLPLDRL